MAFGFPKHMPTATGNKLLPLEVNTILSLMRLSLATVRGT